MKDSKPRVYYTIGARSREMSGTKRVVTEMLPYLHPEVDLNIIDYPPSRITVAKWAQVFAAYPLRLWRKASRDGILHLGSEAQAYVLNYFQTKRSLVTCLDIALHILPVPLRTKLRYEFCMKGLVKADRIIAISQFTKSEIVEYLKYPEDRIDVIYPGIDLARYRPQPRDKAVAQKYQLPQEQKKVLYVGSELPWKNLPTLIRAFAQLKQRYGKVKLVKVGSPQGRGDSNRRELLVLLKELNLEKDVLFLDYVPEEDLPQIYCHADLLVFPVFYQGFAYPPVEAMACGIPVVASNSSVLPEVVGDAAITLEPQNPPRWAEAMYNLLIDKALRSKLREKGLRRAQMFTAQKAAQQTLEVYHKLWDEGAAPPRRKESP